MALKHLSKIIADYDPKRLMSVDFLRGLTIFAMILVNNPGSWNDLYSPLAHAQWHGWTLTDLIFPFFLFIVGLSISLSENRSAHHSVNSPIAFIQQVLLPIIIRSLKLLFLGWLLALSYYNFYAADYNWLTERLFSIRWMGVLQRIALVYFFAAVIFKLCSFRQIVLISLILLIGYWAAMLLIPYHDINGYQYQGLLLPGNNLAAYLDHHLLGTAHLYDKNSQPFSSDPEGLLTTIPALVSCLIGIMVGQTLLVNNQLLVGAKNSDLDNQGKGTDFQNVQPIRPNQSQTQTEQIQSQLFQLIFFGLILVIAGYLVALSFPINKNLWSPSYVLLTSGLAMFTLAFARWLIELKEINLLFGPLLVFGSNAIALFMISGIVARLLLMIKFDNQSLKTILYSYVQMISDQPKLNSLIFAILLLLVMYIPLYFMYQKKLFWKV